MLLGLMGCLLAAAGGLLWAFSQGSGLPWGAQTRLNAEETAQACARFALDECLALLNQAAAEDSAQLLPLYWALKTFVPAPSIPVALSGAWGIAAQRPGDPPVLLLSGAEALTVADWAQRMASWGEPPQQPAAVNLVEEPQAAPVVAQRRPFYRLRAPRKEPLGVPSAPSPQLQGYYAYGVRAPGPKPLWEGLKTLPWPATASGPESFRLGVLTDAVSGGLRHNLFKTLQAKTSGLPRAPQCPIPADLQGLSWAAYQTDAWARVRAFKELSGPQKGPMPAGLLLPTVLQFSLGARPGEGLPQVQPFCYLYNPYDCPLDCSGLALQLELKSVWEGPQGPLTTPEMFLLHGPTAPLGAGACVALGITAAHSKGPQAAAGLLAPLEAREAGSPLRLTAPNGTPGSSHAPQHPAWAGANLQRLSWQGPTGAPLASYTPQPPPNGANLSAYAGLQHWVLQGFEGAEVDATQVCLRPTHGTLIPQMNAPVFPKQLGVCFRVQEPLRGLADLQNVPLLSFSGFQAHSEPVLREGAPPPPTCFYQAFHAELWDHFFWPSSDALRSFSTAKPLPASPEENPSLGSKVLSPAGNGLDTLEAYQCWQEGAFCVHQADAQDWEALLAQSMDYAPEALQRYAGPSPEGLLRRKVWAESLAQAVRLYGPFRSLYGCICKLDAALLPHQAEYRAWLKAQSAGASAAEGLPRPLPAPQGTQGSAATPALGKGGGGGLPAAQATLARKSRAQLRAGIAAAPAVPKPAVSTAPAAPPPRGPQVLPGEDPVPSSPLRLWPRLDLSQVLGPAADRLCLRPDTLELLAFGEALHPRTGRPQASVRLKAWVQRLPQARQAAPTERPFRVVSIQRVSKGLPTPPLGPKPPQTAP